MYEYPFWLLIFVILPLAILWIFKHKNLMRYKLSLISCIIGSIIFSFPWDYIVIKKKIWYFTDPHIFGTWFLSLPVEEWIFIIFITLLFSSITILLWEKYGVRK
jgi:lycopene cyclase domain-containing protein